NQRPAPCYDPCDLSNTPMDGQLSTHLPALVLRHRMADSIPHPPEQCWWKAFLRAWTSPMPPRGTLPPARPGWACSPVRTAAWTSPPSTGPSPTMTPTRRSPLPSRVRRSSGSYRPWHQRA
ncbi:PLD3 isoform 19, partial [Pan troglodytes]